jgi:HK97 gp10 family phage protein
MATRKWDYGTYGKTALRAGIRLSGFDEYLKKIEQAGKNVDEAVRKAIDESVKPIVEDMKAGATRHKRSGDVYEAIRATPAERSGNYTYSNVGVDIDNHPEAIEAVFQEYGDSHSPGFPDPFIRPAFDNNKSKIKKIQREVLIKEGVPID